MTTKIKFLAMMLIAAIAMLSYSGCSEDDDDASNDSLVGTTWEWIAIDNVFTLSFTSKSNFAFSSPGFITSYGTYSYTPPKITLTFTDGKTWPGIVSGGTMTLELVEGSINTFVKK
jgi:Trk-type K+ transport system membrane component